MALSVVRHGRTTANASGLLLGRADPDLDEVGRRQAVALASALPAARVYSSPLSRCLQTAEAIAAFHGAEVIVEDRLIELDYGQLDLTPVKDVSPEVWSAWRSDSSYRPAGGETLAELADRVSQCLDELWPLALDGEVVLVTHVSPTKAAMAWALDVAIDVLWRSFVAPASITKIGKGATGQPSLHRFNDGSHLSNL